jgi:A/G-specific adenine glycosylase
MTVSDSQLLAFLEELWEYYGNHARNNLPWRYPEPDGSFDPYKILVSELMLQQTQVPRVIPKYEAFLREFPTVKTLAAAELGAVLRAWQGLGYNRRAKYLWLAAKQIAAEGWPDDLTKLPGVGVNTAGAVRTYAFNEPAVFIETNIRTVFIHHFAHDDYEISDTFIRDLLSRTIKYAVDEGKRAAGQNVNHFARAMRKNAVLSHEPRDFYWALMDYGSFLKTQVRNLSQSKHYKRQSAFQGSRRQIRGFVIRELSKGTCTVEQLQFHTTDERLPAVLAELEAEGFIVKRGKTYQLAP